jgi:hypothetical protein
MDSGEELTLGQLPDDWWRYLDSCKILSEWFKQFLLGLFISIKVGDQIKYDVYTGFLLEYRQKLLWITVGHGMEELNDILLNHRDDILQLRWMDNCTIPGAETFPVHNRDMKTFVADDIDFGFAVITGLDEMNIRNNNQVQIMTEQVWRNVQGAYPEGFYIIGYPQEWLEIRGPESKDQTMGTATIKLSCLPVEQVPFRASDGDFWADPEGFYGKIVPFADHQGGQPTSPRGMSGAPVISLERGFDDNAEERIRYRLFGIQRSWNKVDTIRAEPIQKVAAIMEQYFEALE